jgi:hypothetical protein
MMGAAAMVAVVATSATAYGAPGIAAPSLNQPALAGLTRVGTIVVGDDTYEARAGRDYTAASLVAAGHQAVALPTYPVPPPNRWLLEQCAAHDLDAVALVRISTDGPASRVNVDIRDPEGREISIGSQKEPSDTFTHESRLVPVFASFSFAMTDADVDRAIDAHPNEDTAVPVDPRTAQPRLWVSRNVVMLGPARIRDAEFYQLVGRPDLYKRSSAGVVTARVIGYTSLGIGVTGFVVGVAASAFESGYCTWPNAIDSASGRPQSCGGGSSSFIAWSLAFSGLGGALVLASYAMASDPVSLETRKALARDYNARMESPPAPSSVNARPAQRLRLSVAAGPLANGDGGVMLINGRF